MTVKFAIYETSEGVEYGQPVEYEAFSDDINYDGSKTETVKDKIDLIAQGYGVYFRYILSQNLVIPGNRSLVVADCIDASDFDIEVGAGGILGVY